MLELRGKRTIGPDRGVELIEGPQHVRFMRQYPEVRRDGAGPLLKSMVNPLHDRRCLIILY